MSKRKPDKDMQRIHIWMEVEHIEWLKNTYGENLGFSKAIQTIIGKFKREIESQAGQQSKPVRLPASVLNDLNT